MKKLLVAVAFFAAIFTTVTVSGQGGMSPEQRAERQKKMKSELVTKAKITETEADKVIQIVQESRAGMRGFRNLSPVDLQRKVGEIKANNSKKFKAIPLTDEQVKAVDTYYDEQIQRVMNRTREGN